MVKVSVKWGKESYEVDAELDQPGLVLKTQLFTLTGVHPDRQKVMGAFKGSPLKVRAPPPPDFQVQLFVCTGLPLCAAAETHACP